MPAPIGKITRRPLREVWKHEERDFTTWLRDNIDVLSEQLGIDLVNPEREQAAGSFSVDIVAETGDGRPVVIENQLERSDHDHLGKLLTYLASFDARVAIWIVGEPRPEHVQAITWLNQANLVDFYLLKVEAIVIGDSVPAPLLTRIVGPSAESAAVGETKKEFAERYEVRRQFWLAFLDEAKRAGSPHASRAATTYNWVEKREGVFTWIYRIREHESQVEVYVDGYQEEGNAAFLEDLKRHQAVIEQEFGEPLHWDAVEGRKHVKLWALVPGGGYRDDVSWPAIHLHMIQTMNRLEAAIRPFLASAIKSGARRMDR